MRRRRSVGASSTPSPSATSPLWIQHSARRVVASVRTDSVPATHWTRSASPRSASRRRTAADASSQRSVDLLGRQRVALRLDEQPGTVVDVARRPAAQAEASVSRCSGRRSSRLASAISSVWARCSTTSATLQPGQRDGAAQARSSRSATRSASSCVLRGQGVELLGHVVSLAPGAMTRTDRPRRGGRTRCTGRVTRR